MIRPDGKGIHTGDVSLIPLRDPDTQHGLTLDGQSLTYFDCRHAASTSPRFMDASHSPLIPFSTLEQDHTAGLEQKAKSGQCSSKVYPIRPRQTGADESTEWIPRALR